MLVKENIQVLTDIKSPDREHLCHTGEKPMQSAE